MLDIIYAHFLLTFNGCSIFIAIISRNYICILLFGGKKRDCGIVKLYMFAPFPFNVQQMHMAFSSGLLNLLGNV